MEDTIVKIIVLVAFLLGSPIIKFIARKLEAPNTPQQPDADKDTSESAWSGTDWPDEGHDDGDDDDDAVHDDVVLPGPVRSVPPGLPVVVAPIDPHAELRRALVAALDRLVSEAQALQAEARVPRATRHIAEVMTTYLLPAAVKVRKEISVQNRAIPVELRAELEHLQIVFAALELFIRQRRQPGLREALGDADVFARACYEPVLDFARANLPELQSNEPVAVLDGFDLAIWTGFIPTGLAPIFLPPRFFADIRWWPALAHEIGHDFLASTELAEGLLRQDLDLPDVATGQRPLVLLRDGLSARELYRVFGAWFEEIFCDVFATLMLGPAYGYTMVELFAIPRAPQRTTTVAINAEGRGYDIHPPRALRVALCRHVLGILGEHEAAETMWSEWTAVHGEPEAIEFPVSGGSVGVSMAVMRELIEKLASRLYSESFSGLDGYALGDIPGLEYGPHRAAETRRACDELLAGKAPSEHRAQAVVAGAILAWRKARDRHDEILALARRAIVGITETREDTYSGFGAEFRPGGASWPRTPAELREAFLLHTVLSPPPSLARMRRGPRSFLERPTS